MEMNSANVEEVVKQVLESMLKQKVVSPAAAPAGSQEISENSTRCDADSFGAL